MKKYKIRKLYYESEHIQVLDKDVCYDNLTGLSNINYLKKLFCNNKNGEYRQGIFVIILKLIRVSLMI